MSTNCAPLIADLFLFCYERDFMLSQSDINEAFNSTSRYLETYLILINLILNKLYVRYILLKANSSDTENPF